MQTTSNILEAVIELSPANRNIVGTVASALLASQIHQSNKTGAPPAQPSPEPTPAPPPPSK